MAKDLIVDEVRAARAALLETAGGTLEGLFEYLARRQDAAGRTSVDLSQQRQEENGRPGGQLRPAIPPRG